MSFGKLLAAGKCIINGRRAAAYRENRHVYLPKFESPKNPFAKVPEQNIPVQTALAAAAPKLVAKSAAIPVFAPAKPAPAPAPVRAVRAAEPSAWARLNPISMFRGGAAPSTPPVVAVQTELSLDTVKVVQNDLSDAEVEVIPIKSRPARPAGAGEGDPAEVWDDLGTKVFRANAV